MFCVGSGAMARELAHFGAFASTETFFLVREVRNGKYSEFIDGRGGLKSEVRMRDTDVAIVAISDPHSREQAVERLQGRVRLIGYSFEEGGLTDRHTNILFPRVLVGPDVKMGQFNFINSNCSLTHDVEIADFVTLSPGVNLGGAVRIAKKVFVGMSATILPQVSLGESSFVGAGAVVTSDVPSNALVKGVPAR